MSETKHFGALAAAAGLLVAVALLVLRRRKATGLL
jgi:LPXTG-motif cell wall-anchored protein